MNSVFVDKNELQKISPVCVKCYMYRDFPRPRYIPSLLYGCLLYASLVTGYLIQPIQNATFFGKNVPKIIFAIMGVSKYFSDLFRPQFSEHVAQFQHSGTPSGKVGPPFKLTFFWTEYCLCSRCIIQK